ncbi:MAG: MATE family efflux transporter [Bacteroidales bacterium]|nr:MATE family efflux transporter [Bacteroidales bacterium]
MNRTTEYSTIWKVSFPIFLSLLAQNLIIVVDTAFLGRLGEVELGAGAIGGLLYVCLFILGFGLGTGSQIIVGRRNGEKRFIEIGKVVDHTLLLLVVFAITLFLLMKSFSGHLLHGLISSHNIREAAGTFLDVRVWGLLFAFINITFRAFYIGVAKTTYLIYSAAIMAIVNIGMDYLLIFGNWGFPRMGIAGAALASVMAEASSVLFFVFITLTRAGLKKYGLFRFIRPQAAIMITLFRVSFYMMLQFFISVFSWFLFFVIIERTGERPLAVSNIIRSMYMIFTIPIWALGATTNTLVSNTLGAGRTGNVLPLVFRLSAISLVSMLAVVALVGIFDKSMVSFYSNDPLLILESVNTLRVVLGVFVLFSVAIIGFNAVSGTANTNISLGIEVVSILFYLLAAWLLAIYFKFPVHIVWVAEYVYVIILGVLSFVYLWKGNWMKKKI